MILRVHGTDYNLVRINEDEDAFINMNPEFIKVENLPYSLSGMYILAEGTTDQFIVNEVLELEESKKQRMEEVMSRFNDMMYYGNFETSLGFTTDNRRGDGKDDKDNVSSLIDLANEPVYFKDTNNNFHVLTIADLTILKQEMIQDGLSKYEWKWTKENEVMSATTLEILFDIII